MLALAACVFAVLTVVTLPAATEDSTPTTTSAAPGTASTGTAATGGDATDPSETSATSLPGTDPAPADAPPETKYGSRPPRTFTLLASGDLLPHSAVYERAAQYATDGGYDFRPMFDAVRDRISSADLAICHLETMLSADNSRLSSYPMFLVPHELADAIADAGYDACSVASNHALDQGVDGMYTTLDELDEAGVRHAGGARSAEEGDAPSIYEVNGVKVGHLSYAFGFNGFSIPASSPWVTNQIDPDAILAEAAAARAAGAEFVVASMHWGLEYQQQPTADQERIAAELLESPDIDLIIGHHAHVIQPIERIGDEVVVYGMGNLLSNQYERPLTQDGVLVTLTVAETDDGFEVTAVETTPTIVERPSFRITPTSPSNHADSYARTNEIIGPVATPTGG